MIKLIRFPRVVAKSALKTTEIVSVSFGIFRVSAASVCVKMIGSLFVKRIAPERVLIFMDSTDQQKMGRIDYES